MLTSTPATRSALTLVFSCVLILTASISVAATQPQPAVEAGDDFFAYANAAWLQATQIPDNDSRWNARSEIKDLTRRQLDKLVDDAAGAPAE